MASLLEHYERLDTETQRGLSPARAMQELTSLFALIVGLLVLSHTGRIRLFKQMARNLLGAYVDQLIDRTTRRTA